MPRYRTEVAHSLGQKEAVRRLRAYSEKARSFSDLKGTWDDNTFTFSVSVQGISLKGTLLVEEDALKLDAQLPLIAMPFAGWVRRILNKGLEQGTTTEEIAPSSASTNPENGARESPDIVAPVVLFLHIPKAGGSTLGEYVYNQCRAEEDSDEGLLNAGILFLPYGFFKESNLSVPDYVQNLLRRADLRAVIGHFWYGIHEYFKSPSTYITLLRDPVDRVVSLYHYLKLQDRMSIEEFVASPPFKEMDNDQTRRIAGVDPEIGGCTIETLQAAQQNLRQHFTVAGTTERFDETLMLLKRKLGWSREIISYPKNVNTARPPTASLSPEVIAAVRSWNELDFQLWQYAGQLMDEAISVEGSGFREELERYKASSPVFVEQSVTATSK